MQVHITNTRVLTGGKFNLKEISFDIQNNDGSTDKQKRLVFDHGNAVAALLYNPEKRTVLLTRQFRLPSFINGNATGMLTEVCAGLLEPGENPDDAVKREIEEETGYAVEEVIKIYEAYTSPGSLTELLLLYVARYNKKRQVNTGGGLKEEGENIQVLELPFDEVYAMLEKGEIKDLKTIILLQHLKLKGYV